MARDNLTFEITGEVSLQTMSEGFLRLRRLIEALTDELSREAKIRWIVEDLRPGSAAATVRGEAGDLEAVERVVVAYGLVGASLERDEPIPFSEKVRKPAREIISLLGGPITAVRFETPESDWTVVSPGVKTKLPRPISAYGAIEGRVETIARRGGLRFVLYDAIHDKAVACYLQEGQEEQLRGAWGRRTLIEGWVTRDPLTGRPSSIRQISRIELLPETAGSYRNARGALSFDPEGPSAEQRIRRLRDA